MAYQEEINAHTIGREIEVARWQSRYKWHRRIYVGRIRKNGSYQYAVLKKPGSDEIELFPKARKLA